MEIEKLKVKNITPYEKNAKKHDERQIKNVMESIRQFGFVQPVVVDKNLVLIIGHCRLEAARRLGMEEVDAVVADGLTEEQVDKLRLLDNKLNESEWDMALLLEGIQDLDFSGFDLDWNLPGLDEEETEEVIEDEVPDENEVEERAKLGDIWKLGSHRLLCGDCTDALNYDLLLRGQKASLVFTDPPYGMKKQSEGVLNDNLNYDDLLDFNREWIPLTFEALKSNGSWYCWGIDEPLMDIYSNILRPMQKANRITFRNLIVWNKSYLKNGNTFNPFGAVGNESARMFPRADEKCLFVMCGVDGFNNNSEFYNDEYEPIRQYMEREAKKVGLTGKKVKEITGTQMFAHWFTKSQFTLITREHYQALQEYYKGEAFTVPYDELRNRFSKLHDDTLAKRSYFANADESNNVWNIEMTKGEEKEEARGHATPKPIELCARGVKSSSREGEIVLDVFGGSGSTMIACEQLNRSCYMMELEPHYCDVIIARWEKFTGQKAELEKGGANLDK